MKKNTPPLPAPLLVLASYVLIVLLVIFFLRRFTIIAGPLFFSVIIAYLFNPLVNLMQKKTGWPRFLLAGLAVLLFFLVLTVFLAVLIPYLSGQIEGAFASIPQISHEIARAIDSIGTYLTRSFPDYLGTINLMDEVEKGIRGSLANFSGLITAATSSLYNLVFFLMYSILIPLFAYYFLKDARKIRKALLTLVPPRHQPAVLRKAHQLNVVMASFVRGQFIVVVILCFLYSLGLSVLGIPFSLLIGLFAGFGDIIPYFGTVCGLAISLVVSVAHFHSVQKPILVLLLFAVVKGSENWFFYPKIVGKRIGMHFLWVLITLIFFAHLFGFWGLLIAIPASAGFKVFLHDLIEYYRKTHFYNRT